MNRRQMLRAAGAAGLACSLSGATPFWERKPPAQWSADEIQQLLTRSPWARETNLDFEATEGGHLELPSPAGSGENKPSSEAAAGVMRRAPVVVRWESAEPVRDAQQMPLVKGFADRYTISVSNIPAGVMNKGRRSQNEPTHEDVIAELQGAATLGITGRDPAGAGLVIRVPGALTTYLFGFSRDLLTLTGVEKEVLFILHTARVSVKAKFEPKNMTYHGRLAV